MKNIKMVLEYEGTNYCGWQKQKNTSLTIQQILEQVLYKILRERVRVIGSARTDKGVHAKYQVANFRTNTKIPLKNLKKALNSNLPPDIRIKSLVKAPLEFNARFWAKSKTYKYFIYNSETHSVFYRRFSWHIREELDLERMKKEIKALLGKKDFKCFLSSGANIKNTVREIYKAEINKKGKFIIIEIKANSFFYKMVRNIVGTLVDFGRGKNKLNSLKEIINCGLRKFAGVCAPPQGLFLWKIEFLNLQK